MGKWLLRFLKLFAPLFRRQGIDTDRLFAIVELKLMMDTRRVYMSWKQGQQSENKNHLTTVLILYGLFGLFMSLAVYQLPSLVTAMIIFHAYVIFMMAMTLITDFSSVLLDTTDNQILLPRPVNSKTLFFARLIHVLLYLFQFSIAICTFPLLVVFYKFGPLVGIAAIITSQLTVIIAVFFTYILYLLLMRFSNEQKVKEIVTYFQIVMTLLFTVGYQIIPRMIDLDGAIANFELKWYSFLLPPVWMALALEAVYEANFDWVHLVMIFLAIAGPVLLFKLMNTYLSPAFARQLGNLSNDAQKKNIEISKVQIKKAMSSRIARLICMSGTERAAFELTWKITGRDKGFRLQFYPSLGYIPVIMFLVLFNGRISVEEQLQALPYSTKFLWLIYLPLFTVATSLPIITFNENFQASWVYHSMPVKQPGYLISGAIKAMVVKFFVPVYLVFFAIGLFIWGIPVADDFLLGLVNSLVSLATLALLSTHYLPFSRQPNVKQQSGRFIQVILQVLVVGALVLVHFLLLNKTWMMYAIALAALAVLIILVKNLQSLRWNKISV
ncbi:MAG: hypothetical protein EOO04_13225 [Chitinophagaceae bacterium]|nr:MAG: hypothetical protein EOO04_13225 [Chitinophagaceae bacterium]